MSIIAIAWLAVAALGAIDGMRHPSSDWAYADRDRGFWVVLMVFLGPLLVVPYLLAVRPRFPSPAARRQTDQFLKR